MKCIRYKKGSFQSGFTLIELIVTLSVAAILLSLAAPAFIDFIRLTKLTNVARELHHAMNLTRMEAIKRNGRVDLVAHDNDWNNGWMVMADNEIIFTHDSLNNEITISSNFPDKKAAIAYNGTGRTQTDTNVNRARSGTLRISSGKHTRLIVINFLGRVRMCNPATSPKTCVGTIANIAKE